MVVLRTSEGRRVIQTQSPWMDQYTRKVAGLSRALSNLLSCPSFRTRMKRKVPSLQAQAKIIQLCTFWRLK